MQEFIKQFEDIYSLMNLALELGKKFEITESKRWNITKSVLELGVQIGHLTIVLLKNVNHDITKIIEEENRLLHKVDDEVADCIFQILCIINKFDQFRIKAEIEDFELNHRKFDLLEFTQLVHFLSIIFGQIIESLMKINQIRFPGNRIKSEERFFINKLIQLLSIIFCISRKYDVDLRRSFITMKTEAENFLLSYDDYSMKQKKNKDELHVLNSFFNT